MIKLLIILCLLLPQVVFAADIGFLIAGQSNASGHGDPTEIPSEYLAIPANVELWDEQGQITGYSQRSVFGPEVSFASAISAVYPEDHILIVKYGVPATSIFRWMPSQEDLYPILISTIETATQSRTIDWKAILWIQGESDARTQLKSDAYLQRYEVLMNNLRSYLGSEVPTFIPELNLPIEDYPYNYKMLQTQWQTDAVIVPVHLLSKQADNVHFDSAGQIGLGQRLVAWYQINESQTAIPIRRRK